MARAFLSGALLGLAVSGVTLGLASVLSGPVLAPKPEAPGAAPVALAPVAPSADALPLATPAPPSRPDPASSAVSPGVPDEPAFAALPGVETAPAPVPEAAEDTAAPSVPGVAPTLGSDFETSAIEAPLGDIESSISSSPVQPAPPSVPAALAAPEEDAALTVEEGARPSDVGAGTPDAALERAAVDPETQGGASGEAAETPAADVPAAPPVLERFSEAQGPAPQGPLMSIVLIDDGASPLQRAVLEAFPYPLTFAIDGQRADAAEIMAQYRAAGFEVVALLETSGAGGPWSDALSAVSEAVAVMQTPGGAGVVDAALTSQLARSGHGLVLYPEGLNTSLAEARRAGLRAAALFRDFDAQGQDARVIRRFLDQAAFKAGQEGAVIMVGRVRGETLVALEDWGEGDRAQRVSLVPLSSVLRRDPLD